MNRVAKRALTLLILCAFLLVGFSLFCAEYGIKFSQWITHTNSPHIYNENGRLDMGAVTDREGILLLDMNEQWTYSSSEQIRKSTLHWVGDRYGNIRGAVCSYPVQAVGYDPVDGLYSYQGIGGVVELTLSSRAQIAALEAMGDRKGTVAVYNYQTGELLCAVSTPTYDPDNIPDIENDPQGLYEGVYLNRFLQASYTPGSIFKTVTLAAALDSIADVESRTFTCTGKRSYGVDSITCENAHGQQTLQQAFCNSCNCAFAELSEELGSEKLAEYVQKLGVNKGISFDGLTCAEGSFTAAQEPIHTAWSAIGQYTDLVNPCSFLTFMGNIAAGGAGARPYVVEKAGDGLNVYNGQTHFSEQIMDQALAEKLQQYMRYNVENKYGDIHFPGLSVCAKTGTAEKDGDVASTATFAGFVLEEEYPLAFMIVVEEGGYGSTACIPIASRVLAVCKEVIDTQ